MDAMRELTEWNAVERLWSRDASLFSSEEAVRSKVSNRLGWLGLPDEAGTLLPRLSELAAEVRGDGVTDVVLLGMGGSSLAPLVLGRVLGGRTGQPRLHVLDTTSPVAVQRVLRALEPATTDVVLSSKSGTTIEPLSLYAIFRAWADAALGRETAGTRFRAVTDPGTPLTELVAREGFRDVFIAPPDVGGRFSALSVFGLVPAAMLGLDVRGLVERGRSMAESCRLPAPDNPGAQLAAWMVEAMRDGRDKLTIATSPALEPFGPWAEQLIAESTGKRGVGLVPVLEYEPATAPGYGQDRAVVVLRTEDDEALASWGEAVRHTSPVVDLTLTDELDLGGEFVRWEFATALTGALLGIDPFDEPDVARAKQATTAILEGAASAPPVTLGIDDCALTYTGRLEPPHPAPTSLADALRPVFDALEPGDYLAALAYLPEDEALLAPLRLALTRSARTSGAATCLELGPRYLHSTGQLHKGGPDSGVFLIVTTGGLPEMAVPGYPFDLATLHRAQAEGDLMTLAESGRRVVRIEIPAPAAVQVERLADALMTASKPVFVG